MNRPGIEDPDYGAWSDRQQEYADKRARCNLRRCRCPDMRDAPGTCPGPENCPLQELEGVE